MRTIRNETELERQKEIIEMWLHTPGIPPDARTQLLEMLSDVTKEMRNLMACHKSFLDDRTRLAS